MDDVEEGFLKALGPDYDRSSLPTVYFSDHAVEIESDGRQLFKNVVYIHKTSKTSRTAQFQGKASEDDKLMFPREWEYYLKIKNNLIETRIGLLPEIDLATIAEMKAVGIYSLNQLIDHDGDHFPQWAILARRILDAVVQDTEEEYTLRDTGRDTVPCSEELPEIRNVDSNKTAWKEGGKVDVTFTYEAIQ